MSWKVCQLFVDVQCGIPHINTSPGATISENLHEKINSKQVIHKILHHKRHYLTNLCPHSIFIISYASTISWNLQDILPKMTQNTRRYTCLAKRKTDIPQNVSPYLIFIQSTFSLKRLSVKWSEHRDIGSNFVRWKINVQVQIGKVKLTLPMSNAHKSKA